MFFPYIRFKIENPAQISKDSVIIPPSPKGKAVSGPFAALKGGIYWLQPRIGSPKGKLAPGAARFEIHTSDSVILEGDLSEDCEIFVRIPETSGFEFRLITKRENVSFGGLEVQPLLEDRDVIDMEDAISFALQLVEKGAHADAVFCLSDRLTAMGNPQASQYVINAFIHQAQARAHLIQKKKRASVGTGPIRIDFEFTPQEIDLHVDILSNAPEAAVARVQLQEYGCVRDFVDATRLKRSNSEPPRPWQKFPGQIQADEAPLSLMSVFLNGMDLSWQVDAAREGVVEAFCPWSGELLTSSHGFIERGLATFVYYRFEGEKPFYLITGGDFSLKLGLFLPTEHVVIDFRSPSVRWCDLSLSASIFRTRLARNEADVRAYLMQPTSVTAVYGHPHVMHFFWNDLSGLQHADLRDLLPKMKSLVAISTQYCQVAAVFPALQSIPATSFNDDDLDTEMVFLHGLRNNLLPVRFADAEISRRLADRLIEVASEHDLPNPPPPAPLVWVDLRIHDTVWDRQATNYANIFNALLQDYGALGVYLHGDMYTRKVAADIKANSDSAIAFFDGTRQSLLQNIRWAAEADTYIVPVGTDLVWPSWIANKPGVTFAEPSKMWQMEWWAQIREDGVPPLMPDPAKVESTGERGLPGWDWNSDFKLDWKLVLEMTRQILDQDFARK